MRLIAALWLILIPCAFAQSQGGNIQPPAAGSSVTLACVGNPGNTVGPLGSLCRTSAGLLYTCNNSAGCTVAGDWVAAGSASSAFSALTGGTNTSAAMVVGSGGSLTPSGTGTVGANAFAGPNVFTASNTVYASLQTGSTLDVQIANAYAALPSSGGLIDASGATSTNLAACPFTSITHPTVVKFAPGTITFNANCTVPANVTIWGSQGTQLQTATGVTVTNNGSIMGTQQIFAAPQNGTLIGYGQEAWTSWFGDLPGVSDSAPAWNAAAAYLYGAGGGTVHVANGVHHLISTNYQVVLPGDDGSYGTPSGGTNFAAHLTISGGVATGCVVDNGGSGYTPSTTNLLTFTWAAVNTGSGITGTASTNGSGVFTSCTLVTTGTNVTVAPTVGLSPQGGDSAVLASTCCTAGAISLPTISSHGAGFPVSTSGIAAGVYGLTCTTQPSISLTSDGSGTITSVQDSTLGVGCSGTPVVVVGNSCAGLQCANVAPETPQVLGCAVRLYTGIQLQGESERGSIIDTGWDGVTSNNSQMVAFCDPDGKANNTVQVSNFYFQNNWMGFYIQFGSSGVGFNQSRFHDLIFSNATGIAMYTRAIDQGFAMDHVWNFGHVNVVCGGGWNTRNGNTINQLGGYCDKSRWEEITYQPGDLSYDTTIQNLDTWFESNIWKAQNGPFTGSNLPNSQCYVTVSTASPRITDSFYGQSGHNNANNSCYQGIAGWALSFLSRNSRQTYNVSIDHVRNEIGLRGIINGPWTGTATAINVEGGGTISGSAWTADPYLPTSSKQLGAVYIPDTSGKVFPTVIVGMEVGGNYVQSVKAFQGSADKTINIEWHGLVEDQTNTFPQSAANDAMITANTAFFKYLQPATAFNNQKNSSAAEWLASCSNNSVTVDCFEKFQLLPTNGSTTPDNNFEVTGYSPYGKQHFQLFGGTGPSSPGTTSTANMDIQAFAFQGIGATPGITVTGTGCVAAAGTGAKTSAGTISMTGTTAASSCTFTITIPTGNPPANTAFTCTSVSDGTTGLEAYPVSNTTTSVTFGALTIGAATDRVNYSGCQLY